MGNQQPRLVLNMKKIILNGKESNYTITEEGRVFNLTTNKELKGSITENGYRYFRLSDNGNKYRFYAHRLVAEYFLPNDDDTKIVNHINGNKLNNDLENLRYISRSENTQAAYYSQQNQSNIQPVICYKDGQYIGTFPSCKEASRQLNCDASAISKCCRGIYKHTHGYNFQYQQGSTTIPEGSTP